MEERICKNCKQKFIPHRYNQRFCGVACSIDWYKHGYYESHPVRKQPDGELPVIRDFYCRHCGTHVMVVDEDDHRTVFCTPQCEKKYWRQGYFSARRTSGNNLSGGMCLSNLKRREAFALRD